MTVDSLNNLLEMFPYFFDKSETSNFYKSQSVTNNRFKQIYNDLIEISDSFRLNKRLLVWKEVAFDDNNKMVWDKYVMRFIATYPLLKRVEIFCDDQIIYEADFELVDDESFSYMTTETVHKYLTVVTEEPIESGEELVEEVIESGSEELGEENIEESTENTATTESEYSSIIEIIEDIYTTTHSIYEEITTIDYSHEATSETIIPTEKYVITITTYDEYTKTKGFPENDEILNDIFDHDETLDEIGAENNVPRRQYYKINENDYEYNELISYYEHTDPPYNNQKTEDDYHYMKRLLTYLIKYHTTPLPVLEIWKLYGIEAKLTNRDNQILHLFDEELHPPDENGEFTWVPEPWEYKDFFADEEEVLGEYFFVSANTLRPVKHQNVTFHIKFLNSLAESLLNKDEMYSVDIFVNGNLIEENYNDTQYVLDANLLVDDSEGNIITFHAKKDSIVFHTRDMKVIVRGCSDADFYVNANNTTEIEDGTYAKPFTTLEQAIQSVNGVYNLIAIYGDIELTTVPTIMENCTIIGCNNARIISTTGTSDFFNLAQNKTLTMQDITVVIDDNNLELDNEIWINNNISDLTEGIITPYNDDYGEFTLLEE